MQGYVTLALDAPEQVERAVNLANSIRAVDGRRPICLVHNDGAGLSRAAGRAFDDFVRLPAADGYAGAWNRLRLFDVSPYRRTMHIAADCLLLKTTIEDYWDALTGEDVNLAAGHGPGGRMPVDDGVFYFERTARAAALFERMRALHRVGCGEDSTACFALALAEFAVRPVAARPGLGPWLASTAQARRCLVDPDGGACVIELPTRLSFGLIPAGWVLRSPAVARFAGTRTRPLYERLARYFAARVGPLPLRPTAGGAPAPPRRADGGLRHA
jgi:hypothetical protein